jgi:hypothetical protein
VPLYATWIEDLGRGDAPNGRLIDRSLKPHPLLY